MLLVIIYVTSHYICKSNYSLWKYVTIHYGSTLLSIMEVCNYPLWTYVTISYVRNYPLRKYVTIHYGSM